MEINNELKIGNSTISFGDVLFTLDILKRMFNFETKEFGGATWLKIYYHNSRNGTMLWTMPELQTCFSGYKWSILGILDTAYNSAFGGYEFLLESKTENLYNRWKQTSNPLRTNDSVSGYQPVTIQSSGNYWKGLALSSTTSTLIDGSPGNTTWWYAIGPTTAYQGGMPGFSAVTQEMYLWLRIK